MKNKYNFIPVSVLSVSVIGAVLVACHVLLPGPILAAVGLAGGIVAKVLERRLNMRELLVFLAFIIGIVLFVASVAGFAAYTVLDYVNLKDIG